ncbi:hypothetical protein BDA99DRAFT_539174 [Phascolomyces articulosus]|uniref:Phospholipid/glycerol acyltransferase domain-containing protein n=1 Tax=Phascolomyces articulosus TaxID=60185 RepID=A0AAD5PCQ9_9FUNG|nr:hypothetical protein BDA99DRAFT_539174 [Phascolomyces articulosus]
MARSDPKPNIGDDDSGIYKALQYLARLAVWVYFRNVKVITRTPPISQQGPLLVAANHMNMVLDPAVLIATFPHARRCHFWALARFFRIPVVGQVLSSAGVLPVDTQTRSNAELFEHTLDCLEHGGVIAVFPEGTSYTLPHHLPFKDGLSWAAYEYLLDQCNKSNNPEEESHILPKTNGEAMWLLSKYGAPIRITAQDLKKFQAEPKPAVKQLTTRIANGVEQGTINSPDWDTLHAASEARFIMFGDTRRVKLEDYVQVSQSFIEIFHPSKAKDDPLRSELKLRLLTFHKTLRQLRLTVWDINMYENHEITLRRAILRLASTWTTLAIQIPLFLPSIIINWPLYLLGHVAEHYEEHTESVAQDKLVYAVILAIPLYGTLIYQFWKYIGFTMIGLIGAILLIPVLAWYHMALVDKRYDMAKEVAASWRICAALLSSVTGLDAQPRRELEDAVQLRQWCLQHTKQLLLDLAKEGDPHAHYLVDYGKLASTNEYIVNEKL